MDRETADELLPKFKHLEGTFSHHFSSKIEQVLVSFSSFGMIRLRKDLLKNKLPWPNNYPLDQAEYTIVAVLKNGRMQSVRTYVKCEQITELYDEVKGVDYMTS
ncbi:MAG TPA: hypothetical protein VEZ17_09985 [Chitinophagaceae bacterium]|jgi:hypothetical protein|nr:hypothetical protein [Chitinophagaceae bacterium]